MAKVVSTDTFNRCLRNLRRCGKKGKDAINKSLAAQAEAANLGEITLKNTNHGESRLKNISKHDLGDGYRLVIQIVDGKEKTFAFLFAGTHEDTERWLNNHKNYMWVKSRKDNSLQFVQVGIENQKVQSFVEPDLESSEDMLQLPLLRKIDHPDLNKLKISNDTKEYVFSINGSDWERDSNGIIEFIQDLEDSDTALFFNDIFTMCHNKEYHKIPMRIKLQLKEADLPSDNELSEAIYDPVNNEIIVTWEEVETLPENSTWSDWLLFLHPEQKKISKQDFSGPARLRGVSGSGKTVVMLHRARYLAIKYKQPILLVTLTESMRKLLEALIKDLCGVESSFISALTVNSLSERIIDRLHPKGIAVFSKPSESELNSYERDTIQFVKAHKGYMNSQMKNMDDNQLRSFINDEYNYVISRLALSELDRYLDPESFARRGRGVRLNKGSRQVCHDAFKNRLAQLASAGQLDYVCIAQAANALLKADKETLYILGWKDINTGKLIKDIENNYNPYRNVLVDEVQDLSQLEVEMISNLHAGAGKKIKGVENGLFLVGDGAQTIYDKGFILKDCGVNVANRSYLLKKNYRNSCEIMRAGYSLIEKYEYADVDEDNIQKPTMPDFPKRIGEKPFIVKCSDLSEEIDFITSRIKSHVEDYQQLHDTSGFPEICVIGLNRNTREQIKKRLKKDNIVCTELKESVSVDKESISISTIESAKGHEFQVVFIADVVSGMIPRNGSVESLSREASRLYVAMTRAREQLYITYSVEGNKSPSPFLVDIQNECNEYENRNGTLKAMS